MNLKKINDSLTKFALFLTDHKKFLIAFLVLSLFVGLTFATPLGNLQTQLGTLCRQIKSLVPVLAFIMLVIAGVIYAAGQVMGAETRARANVWSTAMLVGAIIGLLIVALAPTVIDLFGAGTPGVSGAAGQGACT